MAELKGRGDSYLVRWRAGRGSRYQTCTFEDADNAKTAKALAEARNHRITSREVYAAILDLVDDEDEEVDEVPTVAAFLETWIDKKVDIAPNTQREYRRLIRSRVVPELGHILLSELTRTDIEDWRKKLAVELAPSGVHKIYAIVNQALRSAKAQYQVANPAAVPEGERGNGLPKIRRFNACFLTPQEADILVAHCGEAIKELVLVGLGTGMRLGELLGLRVGDVDLTAKEPAIYVEQTLHKDGTFGGPKTEKSVRTITVSPRLVQILERRTRDKSKGALVFTAPEGGPWQSNNLRRRFWRTAVAAAGRCSEHPPPMVKCGRGGNDRKADPMSVSTCNCKTRLHKKPRLHDMRHTHVGWLIAAKWDFFAIQLRLGHASIKTTFDRYGHRLPGGERKALDALDQQMPGGALKKAKKAKKRKGGKSKRSDSGVTSLVDGLRGSDGGGSLAEAA